jgi:hypothetical protein
MQLRRPLSNKDKDDFLTMLLTCNLPKLLRRCRALATQSQTAISCVCALLLCVLFALIACQLFPR